jgi:uncharacterized protein (TIGR02145 family)
MQQNLNVSHYNNGDLIPEVTDPSVWINLSTGAWCYYENRSSNGTVYGKLYNWFAINDARGLAPEGWHVPADSEWTILTDYLGGGSVAGDKMKEAGTSHWTSVTGNTGTNSSGFTALPGGYRSDYDGTFLILGQNAFWWSTTQTTSGIYAWNRYIQDEILGSAKYKINGFSVRCIKN